MCQLLRRGTAPSYVEHSPVHAIGQRCITSSGFEADYARPHNQRMMRDALVAHHGDVLLNSTGTGTVGRSCIFDAEGDFVVDGHVTVLRTRPDQADPRWITLLLKSHWGQRYLESYCFTGSTNQIELSRNALESTSVPCPPIEEQRRIVDIIDAIDAQVCSTAAGVSKVRCVAYNTAEERLAQLLTAERSTIGREFDVTSGITLGAHRKPRRNALPYLRVANVQREEIDLSDLASMEASEEDSRQRSVVPDDLLVVEGHANPGEIGRCALVPKEARGLLYQNHLFRLRPYGLLSRFALLWLNSQEVWRYWRNMCATSSGLYTINRLALEELTIPVPCQREQQELADLWKDLSVRLHQEKSNLKKLQVIKQSLMNDLLTGRVRVPVGKEDTVLERAEREVAPDT